MHTDEHGNELFWDGFQWVPRISHKVTYETLVVQHQQRLKSQMPKTIERKASKKVLIIENIPFEVGVTTKEIHKFLS